MHISMHVRMHHTRIIHGWIYTCLSLNHVARIVHCPGSDGPSNGPTVGPAVLNGLNAYTRDRMHV